jgi:hypothetical protein
LPKKATLKGPLLASHTRGYDGLKTMEGMSKTVTLGIILRDFLVDILRAVTAL